MLKLKKQTPSKQKAEEGPAPTQNEPIKIKLSVDFEIVLQQTEILDPLISNKLIHEVLSQEFSTVFHSFREAISDNYFLKLFFELDEMSSNEKFTFPNPKTKNNI